MKLFIDRFFFLLWKIIFIESMFSTMIDCLIKKKINYVYEYKNYTDLIMILKVVDIRQF